MPVVKSVGYIVVMSSYGLSLGFGISPAKPALFTITNKDNNTIIYSSVFSINSRMQCK